MGGSPGGTESLKSQQGNVVNGREMPWWVGGDTEQNDQKKKGKLKGWLGSVPLPKPAVSARAAVSKTKKQIGGKGWLKITGLLCPFCPLSWTFNPLSAESRPQGLRNSEMEKKRKKRQGQKHEIRGGKQREWEKGMLENKNSKSEPS